MDINKAGVWRACAGLTIAAMFALPAGLRAQPPQGRGGGQPPAASGPMANEKYKNIQALTNVPAEQLDVTMRYVSAAVNMRCIDCHVQEPSGEWSYEKDDKRSKQTARQMMKMVNGVNSGNYGIQVQCATCHAGRNQPIGLPMAEMLTPEQIAQTTPASRPAGGIPQGAAGFSGGGRGQRAAAPPVDDVINKYIDAIGERASLEKLQALSMTGTVTNRAGQSAGFSIEEKQGKYREARQTNPETSTHGYDGAAGWEQNGTKISDLAGFPLDQALRLNDAGSALHLKEKYANLQAGGGRPMQINGKDTTVLTGRAGVLTEQFYFDSASGLLLRRVLTTRTPLGQLREQIDYADYREAGNLKMPFEVRLTTWNVLDIYKVADAKVNISLDDARFLKPK
jgi:hypothetical protein